MSQIPMPAPRMPALGAALRLLLAIALLSLPAPRVAAGAEPEP